MWRLGLAEELLVSENPEIIESGDPKHLGWRMIFYRAIARYSGGKILPFPFYVSFTAHGFESRGTVYEGWSTLGQSHTQPCKNKGLAECCKIGQNPTYI